MLTLKFVERPGLKVKLVVRQHLANKPLIRRAEFAASGAARPHSTAITARRGREAVRHICD